MVRCRLVELFAGQIRSELSCTVCRKYVTKHAVTALYERYTLAVSIMKSRQAVIYSQNRVTGAATTNQRPPEEKSAATSTVKPLIIGLVSHKSTDRALSRNVAPVPVYHRRRKFLYKS